jgi:DnaJ-class molecular chaperone
MSSDKDSRELEALRVLELCRHSSMPEAKKKYYALSLKHHPDKASTNADKSVYTKKQQQLNSAWEVINDLAPLTMKRRSPLPYSACCETTESGSGTQQLRDQEAQESHDRQMADLGRDSYEEALPKYRQRAQAAHRRVVALEQAMAKRESDGKKVLQSQRNMLKVARACYEEAQASLERFYNEWNPSE